MTRRREIGWQRIDSSLVTLEDPGLHSSERLPACPSSKMDNLADRSCHEFRLIVLHVVSTYLSHLLRRAQVGSKSFVPALPALVHNIQAERSPEIRGLRLQPTTDATRHDDTRYIEGSPAGRDLFGAELQIQRGMVVPVAISHDRLRLLDVQIQLKVARVDEY